MASARWMRSMPKSRRPSRRRHSGAPSPPERRGIVRKSAAEIDAMAAAGEVLAACHDLLAAEVRAGVTTIRLDQIAEEFIRAHGGTPAFKGYQGFPGSICPSVNEQVVHAIPGPYALRDGDIVSIDVGVVLDGWGPTRRGRTRSARSACRRPARSRPRARPPPPASRA